MYIAASRGWEGANPEAVSCDGLAHTFPCGQPPCQSSLVAMTAWSDERTRVIFGLASGLAMPNAASDGPVATIATVLFVEPPITKPPIITSLPVCTCMRVEMFPRRGGFEIAKVAATVQLAVIALVVYVVPASDPPHVPPTVAA